jgi:hypothetical protein
LPDKKDFPRILLSVFERPEDLDPSEHKRGYIDLVDSNDPDYSMITEFTLEILLNIVLSNGKTVEQYAKELYDKKPKRRDLLKNTLKNFVSEYIRIRAMSGVPKENLNVEDLLNAETDDDDDEDEGTGSNSLYYVMTAITENPLKSEIDLRTISKNSVLESKVSEHSKHTWKDYINSILLKKLEGNLYDQWYKIREYKDHPKIGKIFHYLECEIIPFIHILPLSRLLS